MKQQTAAALQFSGYPLFVADKKPDIAKPAENNLAVIKPERKEIKKTVEVTNNPVNWDETWFCNYE